MEGLKIALRGAGAVQSIDERLAEYGDVEAETELRKQSDVRRGQWQAPRYADRKLVKREGDASCEACGGHRRVCPLGDSNWRLCPNAM